MAIIREYCFLVEQQDELLKEIDWQEIWPVKKRLVVSLEDLTSLFRGSTKEMIKD